MKIIVNENNFNENPKNSGDSKIVRITVKPFFPSLSEK